ncbi:TetR family transcriptional regulator C-terminal domain-containing protein [Micromonospora sp. CPCC 206060]|uniref:TetR/AcrR family transcriptional regulator n=1 Tax=Micromonospora sp. CPCC 206060 TaxID=3122406 RepID=UPI002FF0C415
MARDSAASRQRIVAGAADLIRRRGLAGSTIRDLAGHSGAPLGSTYHYFPRGKQQLAAEAIHHAGHRVSEIIDRELHAGPAAALRAFLALWRQTVIDNDFRAGCVVLAVAIEEPSDDSDEATAAAAQVFTTWHRKLATALREHGATPEQAGQVATLVVAGVEGAVAMCRAQRDIRPFDDVAAQLEELVRNATTGPAGADPNP